MRIRRHPVYPNTDYGSNQDFSIENWQIYDYYIWQNIKTFTIAHPTSKLKYLFIFAYLSGILVLLNPDLPYPADPDPQHKTNLRRFGFSMGFVIERFCVNNLNCHSVPCIFKTSFQLGMIKMILPTIHLHVKFSWTNLQTLKCPLCLSRRSCVTRCTARSWNSWRTTGTGYQRSAAGSSCGSPPASLPAVRTLQK